MAKRKNMLSIDFSNFATYAEQLDELGADLREVFDGAMENAAKSVQADVEQATENSNLPAQGRYSKGDTKKSIIQKATVKWSGNIGEIGLGFDKSKPGAGGFLITGTPKMQPDKALEKIFSRKGYETKIKKQISQDLQKRIDELMK